MTVVTTKLRNRRRFSSLHDMVGSRHGRRI